MRSLAAVFALVVSSAFAVNATPIEGTLFRRAEDICSNYDYIIVGGGMSGLVVANRLTELADINVLVIEAGTTKGADPEVLIPRNFISAPNGRTWNITSQPLTELNGRTLEVQVGKVLGGGSAINGMLFDRAAKADYDAWEAMGNPGWNWDSMLTYFKKSETYHPPSQKIIDEFGIEWDPTAHGTSGPIHMSYPPFIYSSVKIFFDALKQIGIPISKDGGNGNALGGFWVPSGVDPKFQTRSYADPAYNDPIRGKRGNYHLLLMNQVTKLISDTSGARPRIIGVEYAKKKGDPVQKVYANKDVIMAAGAIMTPRLLKLSGIGPRTRLTALGIPVLVDLPGVGENLQDHSSTFIYASLGTPLPFPQPGDLSSNATYAAEMKTLYETKKDGPWTNAAAQSLAFLSVNDFASAADKTTIMNAANAAPPNYFTDTTLKAGYDLQLQVLRGLLSSSQAAAIELTTSVGTSSIGMERPFSRGTVDIPSTDVWANPVVDYRAYTHPVDKKVAVAALKFYKSKILTAPAIAAYRPNLILPAASVQTDAQFEDFLKQYGNPSYAHHTSSCMMAKRENGGVVDSSNMRVYGIDGLRIVDASVIPLNPAAHISTSVYAMAEKAADIIKATL